MIAHLYFFKFVIRMTWTVSCCCLDQRLRLLSVVGGHSKPVRVMLFVWLTLARTTMCLSAPDINAAVTSRLSPRGHVLLSLSVFLTFVVAECVVSFYSNVEIV